MRCPGCMEPNSDAVCPHCGWEEATEPASSTFLSPGATLREEYLIGRVLGSDGSGITYLAWDNNLNLKLVIREYFPSGLCTRDFDRQTVVVNDSESEQAFQQGQEQFLLEGQALAKFWHPATVSVLALFQQNGTSYLVTQYADGVTLAAYIEQQPNQRIADKEALLLLSPVMDALRDAHAAGILHRAISPDRIRVDSLGKVKLIGFRSAGVRSSGYSPEEQYRGDSDEGPWTDVYAFAATLYFAVTGLVPQNSLDRLVNDALPPPSRLGIKVSKPFESALMKALQPLAANRFYSIAEFQAALTGLPTPRVPEPRKKNAAFGARAVIPISLLFLLVALIIYQFLVPPKIQQFTVEPSKIQFGQSATIHWSVANGQVKIVPGATTGPLTLSGNKRVSPAATTVYTLKARRFFRTTSRSVKLFVSPPALSVAFTAEPATIALGQSSVLTWHVAGQPKSVSIEPEIGIVAKGDRRTVSPNATTTYSLKAIAADGVASEASAVIAVETPAPRPPTPSKPPAVSFNVSPSTINPGQHAMLNWTVIGNGLNVTLVGIGPVPARDSFPVSPASTTTYKLIAKNSAGVITQTVSLSVGAPPSITSFAASPNAITSGKNTTLSWTTAGNVQSASIDGIGAVPPNGSKIVSPSASSTYSLKVSGAGVSVSRPVTVNVSVPPPVISNFALSPTVVNPGDPVVLRWSVVGKVGQVSLAPGVGNVDPTGTMTVKPESPTTYVLRAQGPGGVDTRSLAVNVSNEEFSIVKFSAKPGKLKPGDSAQLIWLVTGPVTGLSISPGIGDLSEKLGQISVRPQESTTYTLTVHAGTRQLTANAKIKVK